MSRPHTSAGDKIYEPKGGMCTTCVHVKGDCSNLPFSTYPQIDTYNDLGFEIVRVRCGEHKKGEQNDI